MNTLKDYVNLRLTHADKVSEAQGCPLELYDCKKYKPMKDLKIYGESVQEGTPSPQMPIEVQSVGDKSLNLVKDAREVFKNFGGYIELTEDGRECIRIKSAGSAEAILDFKFKENTQYTISFDFKCKYDRSGVSLDYDVPFAVYYTDGSVDKCSLSPIDDTWNKRVLTTKAEKTVSHIIGVAFDYRVYNYIDINTFQIEEGIVATPYEAYYEGYKIPLIIKGKNLLEDTREVFKNFGDYTELTEDGRDCIRIKSASDAEAILDFTFKENTQYTISFDFKCKYDRSGVSLDYDVPFAVYYTDGSVDKCSLSPIDDTWNKRVLTTKAEKTVSHISGISFDYRVYNYIDINTFQIEEGAVATEYEPYFKQTTNIFLDKPLCKIGDYVDYIDFRNNKVVRNIDKLLVDSSLGWEWWNLNIDTEDIVSIYRYSYIDTVYMPNYQIFSSFFPYYHNNNIKDNINIVWCAGSSAGFRISTDLIDGYDYSWSKQQKIQAFLSWAQSIGLEWYLARKTPREEALNIDIPKLKSKTSIIEVDTSLAPSNVFGKYIKK